MLRQLPFQTIGDITRYGLELHVYCSHCFATRRLDLEMNAALHDRAFATTRFRCRRCGTPWAAEDPPGRTAAGRRPDNASVPVVQRMHLGN